MDRAWRAHPITLGARGKVLCCPLTALAPGSTPGTHMKNREASVPTWTTGCPPGTVRLHRPVGPCVATSHSTSSLSLCQEG